MAIAIVVLMGPCALAGLAQEPSLRWKFEKGQTFEFDVSQSTTIETEVDLVKQSLETATDLKTSWTVQEVDPAGTAQIKLVIQSAHLKVTMPLASGGVRTLDVDTAATAANEPNELEADAMANLKAVAGREILLTIDSRGQISKVELDAATKDALRQAPQSMQIRQLLTDDGLREMFASGAPPMPESGIQPGGQWIVEQKFASAAGTFVREQTLTWVGKESFQNVPQEKIELKAVLKELDPTAVNQAANADVKKPQIKAQSTTGTIWFDAQRGMITHGTVDASLTTTAPYREKTITVQLKSHVDLTVRRAD